MLADIARYSLIPNVVYRLDKQEEKIMYGLACPVYSVSALTLQYSYIDSLMHLMLMAFYFSYQTAVKYFGEDTLCISFTVGIISSLCVQSCCFFILSMLYNLLIYRFFGIFQYAS
jgi:hypothetical protein